jgi:hypothetical protein
MTTISHPFQWAKELHSKSATDGIRVRFSERRVPRTGVSSLLDCLEKTRFFNAIDKRRRL